MIEKLCKRIFELNYHAKKKLLDLGIFHEAKEIWDLTEKFEDKLAALIQSFVINFHSVLKCIIANSRKKFLACIEKIKTSENFFMNPPKASHSPVKTEGESEQDKESRFNRMIESSRSTYRKKSLPFEQEKNNHTTTNHSENIINVIEKSSSDKSTAFIQSMNAVRNESSYGWLFKREPDGTNARKSTETLKSVLLDKNVSSKVHTKPGTASKERGNRTLHEAAGRKKSNSKVELVKIEPQTASPMNLLPSIKPGSKAGNRIKKNKQASEEENDATASKKEQMPNYIFVDLTKADLIKNYDILKVEPNCFVSASKKIEAKKIATEKIYNELLGMNQAIKKTISSYADQSTILISKFRPTTSKHEKPLIKNKRLTTPSLNHHAKTIKNPSSINSIEDSRHFTENNVTRKMESEPPEIRTSIERPIIAKLRTQISPQRSKVGKDIRVIQANLRPARELLNFLKLDASPNRQDIPVRTLQDDFEKGLNFDFASRNPNLTEEGIEVKMLKQHAFGYRFDHEKKSSLEKLNLNRRSIGMVGGSPYNDFHKGYKDSRYPVASSNSYLNETKLKATNNSQSTNSIIAKINEEHYINQQLINNSRFY